MALDWLSQSQAVQELLARKRRAKAIEVLRHQLEGKTAPSINLRLQLCDLLMQSGRGPEASPILVGLADEFTRDGFVAKAIAILKRVEKVDPGPHVQTRLESLVRRQRASAVARPLDMEDVSGQPAILPPGVFGEPEARAAEEAPLVVDAAEVGPLPPQAPPESPAPEPPAAIQPPSPESPAPAPMVEAIAAAAEAPAPPAPPQEVEAVPAAAEAPAPAIEATPAAEVAGAMAVPEAVEATASPAVEAPFPTTAEGKGVAQRIRGVFRRFLASIPAFGGEAGEPVSGPLPAPAAVETAGPIAEASGPAETGSAATGPLEAGSPSVESTAPVPESPAPIVEPATPEGAAPVEPAPPVAVPPPAISAAEGEALAAEPIVEAEPIIADVPDAVFKEMLLDLVEDVLRRPPAPIDRGAVLDYAQRLLASPLLGGLSEDELLAIVLGLQLHTFEPGDVLVTEDERSQSLFILVTGRVRVFVRNPGGRNFQVAELTDGDFFGEISGLSGRPRTATIVAETAGEALELDKPTLDSIARSHPRVCDVLENAYIARASNPEAAAVRAVALEGGTAQQKAIEVLEAHFGESRWDPRMRLRLADALLKAGKQEDAVPVLVALADDLVREGYPEKAIAILKKVEQLQRRYMEEVNLAPLRKVVAPVAAAPPPPPTAPSPVAPARTREKTDDRFHAWVVDLVRDHVQAPATQDVDALPPQVARNYGPGLTASPLFADFPEDALLAFVQRLRLLSFGPGEIVITEGEPGQSLFILTTGVVRIVVRDPTGRSVAVCALKEGAFFGEIASLSGRPRSATVVTGSRCEILELDRTALDELAATHPRVLTILRQYSERRTADPGAAAIRSGAPPA